jgi:hypothetical protein
MRERFDSAFDEPSRSVVVPLERLAHRIATYFAHGQCGLDPLDHTRRPFPVRVNRARNFKYQGMQCLGARPIAKAKGLVKSHIEPRKEIRTSMDSAMHTDGHRLEEQLLGPNKESKIVAVAQKFDDSAQIIKIR